MFLALLNKYKLLLYKNSHTQDENRNNILGFIKYKLILKKTKIYKIICQKLQSHTQDENRRNILNISPSQIIESLCAFDIVNTSFWLVNLTAFLRKMERKKERNVKKKIRNYFLYRQHT